MRQSDKKLRKTILVAIGISTLSVSVQFIAVTGSLAKSNVSKEQKPATSVNSDVGIIGLKLKVRGKEPKLAEIQLVFPGTPGEQAQLKIGDVITHVDGVPTDPLTELEVQAMIAGRSGAKVALTIRRGDTTFVKTLTRISLAKVDPAISKMYLGK